MRPEVELKKKTYEITISNTCWSWWPWVSLPLLLRFEREATMHVRHNSIWFQDAAKLTHWQQLRKSGNSAALASYEHEVLSRPPGKNQVKVAMETPGRLLGTTWFLDADAFVQ